jgi:hypothetical protein
MAPQMVWGFALTAGNEITVKLLILAGAALIFFAFTAFERRYLSSNSGLLGALIFLSMPLAGYKVMASGADIIWAAMQFLAAYALIRGFAGDSGEEADLKWLRLVGLFSEVGRRKFRDTAPRGKRRHLPPVFWRGTPLAFGSAGC